MFPLIKHIDDVLPAIDGREEFVVARKDGYIAIDYMFVAPDTFGCLATTPDDPTARIRRECRGIKFGPDGAIIARPYHKFFNVGEKAETQPGLFDLSRYHVSMDKLDGSMIHPAIVHGQIVFMTRMGVTDQGRDALAFATTRKPEVLALCREHLEHGNTPIFEWCSPRNRVVVPYDKDELYLTAIREMHSGDYYSPPKLADQGLAYPGVAICPMNPAITGFDDWLAWVRDQKGLEGFVIRFGDGHMLKVKADDYVMRHKAKDGLSHEKNVLAIVLAGTADDIAAKLPPEDAEGLIPYAAAVAGAMAAAAERIKARVIEAKAAIGDDRKRFALEVAPTFPSNERAIAFRVWGGDDALAMVKTIVGKNIGSGPQVDTIRDLIGGHRWLDFWHGKPLEAG